MHLDVIFFASIIGLGLIAMRSKRPVVPILVVFLSLGLITAWYAMQGYGVDFR